MKFNHSISSLTSYPGTTNAELVSKESEDKKDSRKWMIFLDSEISNGFYISKEFISKLYKNAFKFIYDYLKSYLMFMLLPIFKVWNI